jgi:hypothetical protein
MDSRAPSGCARSAGAVVLAASLDVARALAALEPLLTATLGLRLESDPTEAFLGGSVARARDANGDGHSGRDARRGSVRLRTMRG